MSPANFDIVTRTTIKSSFFVAASKRGTGTIENTDKRYRIVDMPAYVANLVARVIFGAQMWWNG